MTTLSLIILFAALIIYDRLTEIQDVIESNHAERDDCSGIEEDWMREDPDWLRVKRGDD